MASFARRAMSLAQIPSARISSGAADHHGSTKVDFWKQPTNPGNWKEEHFVLISLSGWGLLFYSGYKLATGGKKETPVESTQ
uniref:AT2G20820 protein n=1 Tax=Arabidopsis thaliana TaxID=3702 RepID=C0Z2Y8_ARATH|nr:AT2G20820 [Arabidopsis thaliana]